MLAVSLLAAVQPACRAAVAAPKLIVVVLVDALRADHTSVYGYERDTTPRLAAFAEQAAVFETAIAPSSWTRPCLGTLFSGLGPERHGATRLREPLPERVRTLAERLAERGYATGAVIANPLVGWPGSGFDQGFQVFQRLLDPDEHLSHNVRAEKVVDAGLRFVDAQHGRPAFLYVHLMDVHAPYEPPAPFLGRFPPAPDASAPEPAARALTALDRDGLVARYDEAIAYADAQFGRLLDGLESRGLARDAMIVFVADHGEELGDHGKFFHGQALHDELLRVPLLIKLPGGLGAGRRVATPVQLADVLPTVVGSLGPPSADLEGLDGRPLQASFSEGDHAERRMLVSLAFRRNVAYGLRSSTEKYLWRLAPREHESYFDLSHDPSEHEDLAAERADRVAELRRELRARLPPNGFRHVLRAVGSGELTAVLRTPGWIVDLKAEGLGAGEVCERTTDGLRLLLLPRPGRPREISLRLAPQAAPAWLELSGPGDVWLGADARPCPSPCALPDLENGDGPVADALLRPPPIDARLGLQAWLEAPEGETLVDFGAEARERLRALGYVGR